MQISREFEAFSGPSLAPSLFFRPPARSSPPRAPRRTYSAPRALFKTLLASHRSKTVGLAHLSIPFRPLAHLAEAGSSRRKAGKYTHYFPTNQSETTSFVVFRFASRKKYRIPPKMMSNFSSRPTYREVTACGGTFPDTATYLLRVRHPYRSLFEVVPASEQRLFHPHALPAALVLYYQLAFFTPGISPFEAISRNWIRLMPN